MTAAHNEKPKKDPENSAAAEVSADPAKAVQTRDKTIIRTSFVGIGANVLLAAFKAVVGIVSHSIAVVLDAVNNLSDALSSIVTIIGAKLGAKQPNKKTPARLRQDRIFKLHDSRRSCSLRRHHVAR